MDTAITGTLDGTSIAGRRKNTAEIKIGIIGCGYWGPKLARNFHDIPSSLLAMVSDLREERLADIQQLYPDVVTTRNYEDMLDSDLDAVVIATPVNTHYPLAKEVLRAGKHVFIEKPITSHSAQAEDLVCLANEQGLTLMVGHTFVYNPAVQAIREIIQSNQLGRIYYLNSTRVNLGLLQPDINVMWDLGPHDISILQYILGKDPIKVSARGAFYVNTFRKLHEVVYMVLVFADGVMANLRLSWLDPVKQRQITVVGSDKMLVYDDIADDKVVIYDKGVDLPPYSVTEEEFRASYRHGDVAVHPLAWSEPMRVECEHFLECIRTGEKPISSGVEGAKVLKVLETAQRSLMNGGVELRVEYD
jgi:predicted dehydrogenase